MNKYKLLIITGCIILVIILLFEVSITQKASIKSNSTSSDNNAKNSPPQNSNLVNYTSSQYGQSLSLMHPIEYSVTKGGRPFNMNDEGSSTTFAIQCSDYKKCSQNNQLSITVFENRKKWSIDEWIENSVNKPFADCKNKNKSSTLEKIMLNQNVAYHFTYINDKASLRGCLDIPSQLGSITLYGDEILYVNNESVIDIQKLETQKGSDTVLQKILETLQVQ